MDIGAWRTAVLRVAKSQTRLKQLSSSSSTYKGFPGGSVVKNLPVMQETWVRSLGQKYPLEEEMATHSSILAWEIPWTGIPGRLLSMGLQ